ncbi:Phosphate transport system permease protein [Acetobacteraceae bacterium EV16G]|uniref:phosphate ABC transporter permease subunit PstC n=1 Tax=Sorlinia euscelidii TaxID=3081148 RepID=UPI002F3CDB31
MALIPDARDVGRSIPQIGETPFWKGDRLFRGVACLCALIVLLALGGLVVSMGVGGFAAFRHFGLNFIISNVWNPVTQQYGALAPVFGTVASTFIAVLFAVPIAFGTAFWLTFIAPRIVASTFASAIQLLAAVPSIIFGMWGFFVIVPFMARHVQPFLHHYFRHTPFIQHLVSGPAYGLGLMSAGIVLAIMITPLMTAIMCDVFKVAPTMLRESAFGLGANRWEVMRRIVAPWARTGIIGGIVLGTGRALGETMAVTFVIGNVNIMGWSLFSPRNSVASLIALEFPESAAGSLKLSSLLALGFILMVLSFATLGAARWLLRGKQA